MRALLTVVHLFWRRHPALLYGLSFAFGTALSLAYHPILLFPIALLFLPLIFYKFAPELLLFRAASALLLLISAFLWTNSTLPFPSLESVAKGRAIFTIHSLSKKQKFGRQFWQYRGTLAEFTDDKSGKVIAKNIPCIVNLSLKRGQKRPLANSSYAIDGQLHPAHGYYSQLKRCEFPWRSIEGSFSFAEMRFAAKERVARAIKKSIPDQRSQQFLLGIATGDFDSEELQYELSRFGLQHVMAISGFHFAIVAGIFHLLFRIFFRPKFSAALLLFFLSSYFLFLGATPSILRAWVMIVIVIGGSFVERRANGLNSLGVALILLLLIEPTMLTHIGFLFSCTVTAGILLLYPSVDTLCQRFFIKRSFYEVSTMAAIDQHIYCLLTIFRKVLALSITVNCISLPISLSLFKKFPVMGFVYNWFFPFMVSMALFLLILSFLTCWLPLLPELLYSLNEKYCSFMLDFVYNMPANFDLYLRTHMVTPPLAIFLVTTIFYCAIFLANSLEKQGEERSDFAFI